jgi:hypothetical protein
MQAATQNDLFAKVGVLSLFESEVLAGMERNAVHGQ